MTKENLIIIYTNIPIPICNKFIRDEGHSDFVKTFSGRKKESSHLYAEA